MLNYLGVNYHDVQNWFPNGSANVYPHIWERDRERAMANIVNQLKINDFKQRAYRNFLVYLRV